MLRLPLIPFLFTTALLSHTVFADPDYDGDGIADARDNCPTEHNPGQESLFYDVVFLGDACNPDDDLDGVPMKLKTNWNTGMPEVKTLRKMQAAT